MYLVIAARNGFELQNRLFLIDLDNAKRPNLGAPIVKLFDAADAVYEFAGNDGPVFFIRTTKDAIKYLVMVAETAGEDWLSPDWFRFGASSLLNDLLMQRTKLTTGHYAGPDYFTLD